MLKETSMKIRKEVLETLLIITFGGLVNISIWCTECWGDWKLFWISFAWNGLVWACLVKGSLYLVALLNRWVEWVKNPGRRLVVSVAGVVVLVYSTVFLLHFIFHLLVLGTPYNEIISRFSFEPANLTLVITLGINVVMHGRSFLLNWKQAAIDMEKMKTEQVSSQYQSLKNQVNPHFLFNSLNALSSLVYDDQKKAVQFIRKLSEVYRYVLDKKDEEVVPLSEELGFTRAFVFLQQIRFGQNFKVEITGEEVKGFIPPLAIQLLVENAVKHNIVSESKPLTLKIDIRKYDIVIENTINRKRHTDSTGIGLANLKARYKYLSNAPMDVIEEDGVFKVILPILDLQ